MVADILSRQGSYFQGGSAVTIHKDDNKQQSFLIKSSVVMMPKNSKNRESCKKKKKHDQICFFKWSDLQYVAITDLPNKYYF